MKFVKSKLLNEKLFFLNPETSKVSKLQLGKSSKIRIQRPPRKISNIPMLESSTGLGPRIQINKPNEDSLPPSPELNPGQDLEGSQNTLILNTEMSLLQSPTIPMLPMPSSPDVMSLNEMTRQRAISLMPLNGMSVPMMVRQRASSLIKRKKKNLNLMN